jgi:hypothetical protein
VNRITQVILNTLLDRVEQPERKLVVRVRLDVRRHAAYFDSHDANPRRDVNESLKALQEQGILRLHWRKWEEDNWLETVDLVPERAGAIYEILGRQPRTVQQAALLEILKAQTPHAAWHARFLEWAAEQVSAHRRPAPLELEDHELNSGILAALDALAQLAEPVLERTLSTRVFGDSKRLRQLRGAILAILREHDVDSAVYAGDDWALLRAHNLERVPEYITVAGPVSMLFEGNTIDLAAFTHGVALPASMLRGIESISCSVRSVISVENATSFNELVMVLPSGVAAIYTGGFASPSVITLLRQIREVSPAARFFHWGDCDAGGLRILTHLRASLSTQIGALAMNAELIQVYQYATQRLTPNDNSSLTQLRAMPVLSDCKELIDYLLENDCKLEQEAVAAEQVLRYAGLA